jgi:hypothetical protein
MDHIETEYGRLEGVEFHSLYSNGKTDGCKVSVKNTLTTPYGDFVPQYFSEDMGRRTHKPVYFYKNGALKSLPLQERTTVMTGAGEIPAELVTFYESGSIKRVFPLDGKLSGFWSWQNEVSLAEELHLQTPAGEIRAKIIAVRFHESGAVKSVTLWPGQSVSIDTPYGRQTARTGIAFYENGAVRSYEPYRKTVFPTPIGMMTAFDNEPNGIHGDLNSLRFDGNGLVSALSTIDNKVEVTFPGGSRQEFKPGIKNNVCGDERKISVPMKIRFEKGCIIFNDGTPFELDRYKFEVKPHDIKTQMPVYSCAG